MTPLLANVYLDRLDQFVERELIPRWNRGVKRKPNPDYVRVDNLLQNNRERLSAEEYDRLVRLRRSLPSRGTRDPGFRRLRYVRYADDFLLRFIGPKDEADEIRGRIRDFLSDQLRLKLSEEKTLITHASDESARFLGYELRVLRDDTKVCPSRRGKRRCINGGIGLSVPREVARGRLARYMRRGKPTAITALVPLSDLHIVTHFQGVYRGVIFPTQSGQ